MSTKTVGFDGTDASKALVELGWKTELSLEQVRVSM